ncbi:MAG TPA: hypothetical protein VF129_07695 [Actinomycetota bacterium]
MSSCTRRGVAIEARARRELGERRYESLRDSIGRLIERQGEIAEE